MFVVYIAWGIIIMSNRLSNTASVLSCYDEEGKRELLQIFLNENALSNFQ